MVTDVAAGVQGEREREPGGRTYIPENKLVILEKIELTEGIRACGRKPATTTTSVAARRAYSIMSCPRSFRHNDFNHCFIDFAPFPGI